MSAHQHVLFKLVQSLYFLADFFTSLFLKYSLQSGVIDRGKKKTGAVEPETEYRTGAHVATVLWKSRKMELEGAELGNFILRHESFQEPKVVLDSPEWTLMAVDRNYAIFVDCGGNIDAHNHQVGPFFYINQFNHCKRLLRIPWKHFIRLMKEKRERDLEAGIRPDNLILISNTGRYSRLRFIQPPKVTVLSGWLH